MKSIKWGAEVEPRPRRSDLAKVLGGGEIGAVLPIIFYLPR